jgi:hypothetical protein
MVDFRKRLKNKSLPKKINPVEIYDSLDRRSETGPLRPSQEKIITEWYSFRSTEKNNIIKLHTGEGKTLIGLLLLLSKINSGNGPCIYICPNKYLAEQIDQNPNLTILHHYYINGTAFPGQKSKFNYKDVALNEQFLDLPNIKLISGHLHQGFTYKNYLCLGSVRSTSPLEINQNKYIFQYNTTNKEITALPIQINPQILIQNQEIITEEILQTEIQNINEANKSYFSSEQRNILFSQEESTPTKNIALTIQVEHIDYDKINEVVDPELRKTCKDLRLKKKTENLDTLLSSFKVSSDELS